MNDTRFITFTIETMDKILNIISNCFPLDDEDNKTAEIINRLLKYALVGGRFDADMFLQRWLYDVKGIDYKILSPQDYEKEKESFFQGYAEIILEEPLETLDFITLGQALFKLTMTIFVGFESCFQTIKDCLTILKEGLMEMSE